MLEDVLAIPDHLRDALWRVESARLEPRASAGMVVCGMGGSAIGGDLAAALLGDRLDGPLATVRGYRPPPWAGPDWTVLCTSYSGDTEETLSCFELAGERGARRIVAGTGGALVERARDAGVPVVGLPGILQPRAAVAYMTVVATSTAALSGVAPNVDDEIEGAASFLAERAASLESSAAEIAERLQGTIPVVYGAGLTAAVARRWKTQLDENAKVLAFFSELPEADHNEICGWEGLSADAEMSAVMLEDPAGGQPRLDRRFELTAAAIADAGADVIRLRAEGRSPAERLFSSVMLGDLASVRLAGARGVDTLAVEAIDRLKAKLG